VIGGGSATSVADAGNANHGYEPIPFTFTVAAPAAPSASLSATSLAFDNVTVGQSKSLAAVSVKNSGTAALGVTGVAPCSRRHRHRGRRRAAGRRLLRRRMSRA
jgi:hypothetical protein